ncbi:MAG: hypothetical protein ABTR54_03800 [Candidatus Competibacter sp.]|nr:hypothetical protein [Candidatus Competibacter sp.]HUM90328.1 hypothetical protein [Candidatus Competibacter sp.]
MKRWRAGLMALLVLLSPIAVWAQQSGVGDVEVEVISDRGRTLPEYPVRRDDRPGIYKAYLEARRGQNYSIRIRNRTNQRVGVVIAVDGRNIISGARSELRPDERMYVLGPYQQETYEGWRTGRNRVNRFYFTDAGDSYSGAWGDYSAMGVIAVAAFQEVNRPLDREGSGYTDQRGLRVPPAEAAPPASPYSRKSTPGTGYGESEWSPSRRVEFDPERRPFSQYFLKYVWRDTLCREGVIDCDGGRRPPPRNRFWDEDNDRFAPPPPRRERYDGDEWR